MNEEHPLLNVFAEKENKIFKAKIGVFLFLIQDGQILLLRRYRTGIDDGKYVVPMGAIKGREKATEALIREVQEETNILLKKEDLQVCHVMHRFHPMPQGLSFEQIDIFFKAATYKGVIENLEPHKCDDLRFFPLDNLPENTAGLIRHALDFSLRAETFSEYGWE